MVVKSSAFKQTLSSKEVPQMHKTPFPSLDSSALPLRPRRLRLNAGIRSMVEEHRLNPQKLILPLFVSERSSENEAILSLPGVDRIAEVRLLKEVETLCNLGASSLILFPVVQAERKTPLGQEAYREGTLAARCIASLKREFPHLVLFADVALDPYTSHGHDGVMDSQGNIDNDLTVEALMQQSLLLAQAGVDFVAPSDMMDGRVMAIRRALDRHGFTQTGILAYSAKFASSFYGPFREAVASGARGLDKRSYQLSTANTQQALREARLDQEEGADMLMVKPILCYLDILHQIKSSSLIPVVAYHVSGEYAMLKAAAQNGWIEEAVAVRETLVSIFRAGADMVVSYYGKWVLEQKW
jgi:porphobilinogen synthase